MIKAVIIGFSHMHVNEIALYISQEEGMELVAVADMPSDAEGIEAFRYTPFWNLQNVKEHYCSRVYEDYHEMLDREKPDIAFILTENIQKPEAVEECAKRGINVSIEKPIAVSYEQALRIQTAVQAYGIEAVVNWPVVWRPNILKMMYALEAKTVGEAMELRYWNGHTGPLGKGAWHRGVSGKAQKMTDEQRGKTWWHQAKHGGGVFLDIACYGAFFTQWIIGNGEKTVLSTGTNLNTPFGDTEDNFAAIVRQPGKLAVIEGTWTTPRKVIPSGPMVLCTDGVLTCTGGAEESPDVRAYDLYGTEVPVSECQPGKEFLHMPSHYVYHTRTKNPIHPMLTLDANMKVMAILDAVIRASGSGKMEKV